MSYSVGWQRKAVCLGMPTAIFFPGQGQTKVRDMAKATCQGCPVQQECLTFCLDTEDPSARHGIYGGLAADERKKLFGTGSVPLGYAS